MQHSWISENIPTSHLHSLEVGHHELLAGDLIGPLTESPQFWTKRSANPKALVVAVSDELLRVRDQTLYHVAFTPTRLNQLRDEELDRLQRLLVPGVPVGEERGDDGLLQLSLQTSLVCQVVVLASLNFLKTARDQATSP